MNYDSTSHDRLADSDRALTQCPATGGGQITDCLFPEPNAASLFKGRMAFLLVLICYAIIDYDRLQWVPLGMDTGHPWHVFYAAYAELTFHNDLAFWFPYGAYGQPNTLYNLMELTPTDYLLMAVGKVFQIKNALVLFQLSLLFDHLLFLFGMRQLAGLLFRRPSTVWFCLIGSIAFLHAFQLTQIQVFRMVGWYPLILYFLMRFFRERRAGDLWLAGIIYTFSCLGNAYQQPWTIMCLAPFVAVATWLRPQAWREVIRCRAGNLLPMICFAGLALLYLSLALHALERVETLRDGRTGTTGVVDLETFSGDKTRIFTLSELVLSLVDGHIFYLGLLPIGCVVWGLFRVRSPLFLTCVATLVFLVWFSLGGVFALALYHTVPFVPLLHYIYMGYHFVPLILLLAAAAVWEQVPLSPKLTRWSLLLLIVVLFANDFSFYGYNYSLTPPNVRAVVGVAGRALLKLAGYGGLLGLAWLLGVVLRSRFQSFRQRWPHCVAFPALGRTALLVGYLLDVFSYSHQSGLPANGIRNAYDVPFHNWSPFARSAPVYQACYIHPLTWQAERLDQPREERKRTALETPAYFYTYAFAQFDPCRRQRDLEWRGVGTAMRKLLALRDADDKDLQTILGCHAPKLRLLTQAFYVNSQADAESAVRTRTDLASVAILEWSSAAGNPPMPRGNPKESAGDIEVTDFSANAISIKLSGVVPGGAWLIYADTYDPRWQAWVNGKRVPLVPAYVGLKAVWVPPGESEVRMRFAATANVGTRILAIGGAFCSLALLVFCVIGVARGFPSYQRRAGDAASPAATAEL